MAGSSSAMAPLAPSASTLTSIRSRKGNNNTGQGPSTDASSNGAADGAWDGTTAAAPEWRLVTIPCSTFCDKARWALDMTGHPYTEDMYPACVHFCGTIFAGLWTRTVPQLVGPGRAQVVPNSQGILRWAAKTYPDTPAGQLFPPGLEDQVAKWEKLFDDKLGRQVLVVAFYHFFQEGLVAPLMSHFTAEQMPSWRSWTFRTFFPVMAVLMKLTMNINASYKAVCLPRVRAIFAEVSEALSDGRPFLVPGSTAPTAADITFAALTAPLLAPPNMGGKLQIPIPRPQAPDWPGAELAATRAGRHALHMYQTYRIPPYHAADE